MEVGVNVSGWELEVDRVLVQGAGPRPTGVTARATATSRWHGGSVPSARVSGKDGESAHEISAVAGRTLRDFAPAHQQLELTFALFAGVFEQRHQSYPLNLVAL